MYVSIQLLYVKSKELHSSLGTFNCCIFFYFYHARYSQYWYWQLVMTLSTVCK